VIVAVQPDHYLLMNRALASLTPLFPVAVLALSSPAWAGNPVRLAYEAPEGCPAQPDFVAAVAARGGDFDGKGSAGAQRVMVVAIRRDDHGFAGAFQVREEESASNKREVHGQSCGEVVDALAVVTAIALRSDSTDLAATAAPVADVAPSAPPTAYPLEGNAPVVPPTPERLRGHTQFLPPRTQRVEVGPGTLRFDRVQSVTASVGAVVGPISSLVMPRYDLSFLTANFVTTPEGSQRIDGMIVDVRVSLLGPSTYRSMGTTTALTGGSLGMNICASPLYDTRGLVLLFCAEYGGGFMNMITKGADGSQIQSKTSGYATAMFAGNIQYNLGSSFLIGVKVGGGLNLGSLTAERADGSRIFGSSTGVAWSAYGLLGIGLHF
jgi:hypothetical protein